MLLYLQHEKQFVFQESVLVFFLVASDLSHHEQL